VPPRKQNGASAPAPKFHFTVQDKSPQSRPLVRLLRRGGILQSFLTFRSFIEDCKQQQFTLLCCGSCDGFSARDFHGRSDGHSNTRESEELPFHAEESAERPVAEICIEGCKERRTIIFSSDWNPHFLDIAVYDNCNANTDSYTYYGQNVRPSSQVSLV
jgi:hypothetical protein